MKILITEEGRALNMDRMIEMDANGCVVQAMFAVRCVGEDSSWVVWKVRTCMNHEYALALVRVIARWLSYGEPIAPYGLDPASSDGQ